MNYRDFHPGDIVYIYDTYKKIERVDRTHIATRGPKDSLELWAYSEHIHMITYEDDLILKGLGFIKKDDYWLFDIDKGYTIFWKPINAVVVDNDNCPHRKVCKTLGDVQQLFYQIAGFEIPFDYE